MKSAHILLVEDNEGDILLITEALEDRKIINKISVVKNGRQVLDFEELPRNFAKNSIKDGFILF